MSIADLRKLDPLEAQKGNITCLVKYTHAGNPIILSSSYDKSVYAWAPNSENQSKFGKIFRTFSGKHKKNVYAVDISTNGEMLVSVGTDGGYIWDFDTKDTIKMDGHTRDVYAVSISQDGTKIVTGSVDKSIILWNTEGRAVHKFEEAHKGWVTCINFKPSEEGIVVSGGADGTIKVWDIENNTLLYTFMDGNIVEVNEEGAEDYSEAHYVTSMAFSSDGGLLVYGGKNSKVYLVNMKTNELVYTLDTDSTVRAIAAAESTTVVAIGTDSSIYLWDIMANKVTVQYSLKEVGGSCRSLVFSGEELYCGLTTGSILRFECNKRD